MICVLYMHTYQPVHVLPSSPVAQFMTIKLSDSMVMHNVQQQVAWSVHTLWHTHDTITAHVYSALVCPKQVNRV